MEPLTLATTAITLAMPFLLKSGGAIAEKIGEDIWTLIKKPFGGSEAAAIQIDVSVSAEKDELIRMLADKLNNDGDYKSELELLVEKIQKEQSLSGQQIVTNNGTVEKQVNANIIKGGIQF